MAVCTRGRPDDLQRCLAALIRVDYPALDLLVVDNAPAGSSVADLIRDRFPQARHVSEPRPGLDWARNRAILETTRDVLAFTDDDAVADPGWLKALVAPFVEAPNVMATVGVVTPYELETAAQQLFERHGGLGRGFVRRWVQVPRGEKTARAVNVTTVGTGANMAFRRSLFEQIGGFDPALGAGTASAAGDEVEMFFRTLKAGYMLAYEPSALVRHRHRRDYASIRTQLRNWLMGTYAAAELTAARHPDEWMPIVGFGTRLLLLYFPRRLAAAAFGSGLSLDLVFSELRGLIGGRGRYETARIEAARIAARFPAEPSLAIPDNIALRREARPLRATRNLTVNVNEPLSTVPPGPDDADCVRVEVTAASRQIGTVNIVCGGWPIARQWLADAIVAQLAPALVNVGNFKRALDRRWQVPS